MSVQNVSVDDLYDLYDLLTHPQYYSQHTLTLPYIALQPYDSSGALLAFYQQVLSGGPLVIQQIAQVQKQDNAVLFTGGIGACQTLRQLAVTSVTFTPQDSGTLLEIKALQADGFALSFADSFSSLQETCFSNLSWQKATLTLSSDDALQGNGFPFTGELELAGFADLGWLFNRLVTLHLSGKIAITGGVPTLSFSTPITGSVSMGKLHNLALTFHLTCQAIHNIPTNTYFPRTSMGLSFFLTFGSENTPLTLTADLTGASKTPQILTFTITGLDNVAAALEDFADWAAADLLHKAMPPKDQFDPTPYLTLDTLSFVVNPRSEDKLVALAFDLTTTHEWPVSDGYLDIADIHLRFLVTNPVSNPQAICALLGDVIIGDKTSTDNSSAKLRLGATVPNFTVYADLDPTTPLNIPAFFKHFGVDNSFVPDLTLDEFDLQANPSNGTLALNTALTGDWSITVGKLDLALESAWLALDYQKGRTPYATNGVVGLQASIGKLQLIGNANLHQSLTIAADYKDAFTLQDLVEGLTLDMIPLSDDFPDIVFTNSSITISASQNQGQNNYQSELLTQTEVMIEQEADTDTDTVIDSTATPATDSTTIYDLLLHTNIDIEKIGTNLDVMFEARKDGDNIGFLFALLLPDDWLLDKIWSDLHDTLAYFHFQQTGLIISSFPQTSYLPTIVQNIKGAPASLTQGITFFTDLKLEGPVFGQIGKLFSTLGGLDLAVCINTSSLLASTFKASLGTPSGSGTLTFDRLEIDVEPAKEQFSLLGGLTLDVSKVSAQPTRIKLGADAVITLPSPSNPEPSFTFDINMNAVETNGSAQTASGWQDPFGIEGFTFDAFGLEVEITETVNVDFLGAIEVGEGNDAFRLKIGGGLADFEVPTYIEFDLDSEKPSGQPITLADMIHGFTSTDVSGIPLLGEIGLKQFDFKLVLEPMQNPINPQETWAPGIAVQGDVDVLDIETDFTFIMNYSKGLVASVNVHEKIDLLGKGLIVLAKAKGSNAGPCGSLDTTILKSGSSDKKWFTLGAYVNFLQMEAVAVDAWATTKGFHFQLDYTFLDVVEQKIECDLNGASDFYASYDAQIALDVTVGPLSMNGVTIFPSLRINPDIRADFGFDLTVNKEVMFEFDVHLSFDFLGVHFAPSFKLSVAAIENLWDDVKHWLETNANEIFKDLLHDLDRFLHVFADKLKALGQDIANILKKGFHLATKDAIAALQKIGYELNQVKQLLENAYDDVVEVLEDVYGYFEQLPSQVCSATTAVHQMYEGADADDTNDTLNWLRKFRSDLEQIPLGQIYLNLYNDSNESVNYLLNHDPGVQQAMTHQHGIDLMNQLIQAIKDNDTSQIDPNTYESGMTIVGQKLLEAANNASYADQINAGAVKSAVLAIKQNAPQYIGLTYDQILQKMKDQSAD